MMSTRTGVRALVMVTLCYGALEIVGLLLLLLTWNYRSITLLYNLTIALLYIVLSVTMARIVARLLNIF